MKFSIHIAALLLVFFKTSIASSQDNFSLDGENGVPNTTNILTPNSSPSENGDLFQKSNGINPGSMGENDLSSSPSTLLQQSPNGSLTTPSLAIPNTPDSSGALKGDGSIAPVKMMETRSVNDFGGVPPLPGTRRNLAPGEAPEHYSVEEGDTMFDICSQLIDDGNYWPKLWSLNTEVRNPHFIYPGMRLAFYAGDQDNPPYLEVVTDDEMIPVEKDGLAEADLVADIGALTGGREGRSAQSVFASEDPAPIEVIGPKDVSPDGSLEDGFVFAGNVFSPKSTKFLVPAFYFEDDIESLGEVVSGTEGQTITGEGKNVVIRMQTDLAPGTFTIVRRSGAVKNLDSGDDVGVRYEFVGHFKGLRKNGEELMEGTVFDARDGLQEGDLLMKFMSTHRQIENTEALGSVSSASGAVIGFSEAGKQSGGKGDLVYLTKEGLSAGGFYSVFQNTRAHSLNHQRDKELQNSPRMIAVARVIEIQGQSALAMIVEGQSEVKIGDILSNR